MSPLGATGDIAGLLLLVAAIAMTAAGSSRRECLVEDRVSRPAPLELEEAVGPGDHQHSVP
jgi:hypothetical protein